MAKLGNLLNVIPYYKGNTVGLKFKTTKDDGILLFENGTFYKVINGVKTEFTSGGGGTTDPAGADTQIQYNDSGSFGASSGFTYDDSSRVVVITGNGLEGNKATIGFSSTPDDPISAYIQETIAQSGAALDIYATSKPCIRLVDGTARFGDTEGTMLSISNVSASTSNPPTNAEIEANCPYVSVQGETTSEAGLTYYLTDTNTGTTYLCYASDDSVWKYTALTAAL